MSCDWREHPPLSLPDEEARRHLLAHLARELKRILLEQKVAA